MSCCSNCGSEGRVSDTRLEHGIRRRRRVCDDCDTRWTTFEVTEELFKSRHGVDRDRVRREVLAQVQAALAQL